MVTPKDDKRTEYKSGALRSDRTGRGRYDLISPHGLKRLAIQYEEGGIQKGDNNWKLGFPISRALCSAIGHIMDHLAGDRSEDHHAAASWQLFCAMHFEVEIEQGKLPVELDDVPFDASTLPPDTGVIPESALMLVQAVVGDWCNTKFPKTDSKAICKHLDRELIELKANFDPTEAADCFLLLMHLAHQNNFDLLAEALAKHQVNLNRKWAVEPDDQNVYRHIDEE